MTRNELNSLAEYKTLAYKFGGSKIAIIPDYSS